MIAPLARFPSPHGAIGAPLAVTSALALAALALLLAPRPPRPFSLPAIVRGRRWSLVPWGPLGRWMLVGVVLLAGLGAGTVASADTAATLTVCPSGCPYTVIQDAVNAAAPGDTVQVSAGTYTQTVTIITSLTLAGVGVG